MVFDHFIITCFLICKRSSIDVFNGDNMLNHHVNHILVIFVILTIRFSIFVSCALHPFFNRYQNLLYSCYGDIVSHFICNPIPYKIFKINHNALGCYCKSVPAHKCLEVLDLIKALDV